MRLKNLSLFVASSIAICLLISLLSIAVAQSNEKSNNATTTTNPFAIGFKLLQSARARFKLPRLIDFSHFKTLFGKHYSSLVDEMVRRKIFMTNTVRASISAIRYKFSNSSTYQTLNPMSDWTAQDIERDKISADKMQIHILNAAGKTTTLVEANGGEITIGLESLRRRKRSLNLGAFLGLAKKKFFEPKNDATDTGREPLENNISKTDDIQGSGVQKVPKVQAQDEVYVDLRDTKCFLSARSQGQCGGCYAFAAIAMYEYHHCRTTGQLKAFSEQYVIDCGQRQGLNGCNGGNIKDVAIFINTYGLELRTDYPYRKIQDKCPYAPDVKPNEMGHIRASESTSAAVELKNFDEFLRRKRGGPILFGLRLNPDFRYYGGGVDDNLNCQKDDAHAMLIVGHGREDGKEYYLFRNSHSLNWGQAGYYKLNKEALARCAVNDLGIVSLAKFSKHQHHQRDLNSAGILEIKRRYNEYMMKEDSAATMATTKTLRSGSLGSLLQKGD